MFIMRTTHSYLFERVLRSFSHECRVLQEHYLKMHDYQKLNELYAYRGSIDESLGVDIYAAEESRITAFVHCWRGINVADHC